MADEEKTESISTGNNEGKGTQKGARKNKMKTKQTSRKLKAEDAVESAAPPQSGGASADSLPLDKILAALLIVSIIMNGYLFIKNDALNKEITALTQATPKNTAAATVRDSTSATVAKAVKTATGSLKLEFYVMSQCPYGTQVLDAIAPVLKSMGDSIDFSVNFIATDSGGGKFTSLHGQGEVDENIRELCAMKYYSEGYKYMDYIVCRDKDIRSTAWEACATTNGLDAAKIKACAQGSEGPALLSASIKASTAAKAQGSPTMFLNGAPYNGGRTEMDFKRAICNSMATKHAECKNLPEPVKFDIIILNDERCADCDTTSVEGKLIEIFPGAVLKKLDYSSPEGKKAYDDMGGGNLPALLFNEDVKKDSGYSQVSRYFEKAGKYDSLKIGSEWDPYCDASSANCADEKCASRMSCRKETPKTLDVFVMSQCPFGVQALNAMKEFLGAVKDVKFSVHFIGETDPTTGAITSMHGQAEVDDDLREICAMKYYPTSYKYMDFIWCRNANLKDTNWQKCATDNGMDAAKIKACAEGAEGKSLLSQDMKIAQNLGIGGSPTWLANNKYQFSGVAAAAIQTNYCKYNSAVAGCEKTLSQDTGGVAATGGCG